MHQTLTLYGLGAPCEIIEQRYKANATYQRPAGKLDERVLEDMENAPNFKKYLANENYYHDFLVFWQTQFEKKGWENVLNEYVFAGDERSDDLLGRFFGGMCSILVSLWGLTNLKDLCIP